MAVTSSNLHSVHGRDLRGRSLAGVVLQSSDLRQADLSCADLNGADLQNAHLDAALAHAVCLRRATLVGADLSQVQARDADFEGANLQQAVLRGANLTNAVFLEADLRGADFTGAILRNADLRSADLTGAILTDAVLDGADLAGALLTDAQVIGLTARGARIQALRDPTEELVHALRTAGAQARPPLALGRLAAILFLATQTVLRTTGGVFQAGWALTKPARNLLAPLATAIQPLTGLLRGAGERSRRMGTLVRQIPGVGWQIAERLGHTLTDQARRSREVATEVRREGQARLRQRALDKASRIQAKAQRQAQQRAERAARAQARLPGGPGADLRGQNFQGRRLAFAMWNDTDLREARLDGANLDKADLRNARMDGARLTSTRLQDADLSGSALTNARLDGARLRGAVLFGVFAQKAQLIDADLRGADLRQADLTGANLTGADLRGALLGGARLQAADLTGARLPDVDLVDAILDHAILEQADLAGVRWAGASVQGTDLTGALGLTVRQREALRDLGAQVDEIHLERILGRIGARPVQVGVGVLALGMSAYLTARFMGTEVIDPARLEVQAQDLRTTDPAAASERYAELAELARRLEDRIGYLVEAADLADAADQSDDAEALLREAMEFAEGLPAIHTETRLRLAVFLSDHQRWQDSLVAVEPLVQEVDQPTEQRARALILYDRNRAALGITDDSAREAVFSALGDLPETQADLHLALAEIHANDGDTPEALEQVKRAESLEVPVDLALRIQEARARVYDRSGDLARAIETWRAVELAAPPGSIADQAAPLAIADLHLRQGRIDEADRTLRPLLDISTDDRIRGRALLVRGRIAEKRADTESAIIAYRAVLNIEGLDTETIEEARIALASQVLSEQGATEAMAILTDLAPDAVTEVMAHARLGEARALLDAGQAIEAHRIYTALAETQGLGPSISRASQAGLGEALSQMGELRDALDIWRELLATQSNPTERIQLELLLANGLLQGGKRKEAATAFRSLADSDNPEAQAQGLLGLAEVARASDELRRASTLYRQVADQHVDTAWRVRALQELADMASASGQHEDEISLQRELIGAMPPSHPAAPDARLALVGALLQSGNVEEATSVCQQAITAAPNPIAAQVAQIACAEVSERGGRWEEALQGYARVLSRTDVAPDVLTDAALGSARASFALGKPEDVMTATDIAYASSEDPALRLPLLSMKIRALRTLKRNVDLQQAIADRNAMAELAPEIAWNAFVEAAGQSRTSGDSKTAVDLLESALAFPLATDQRTRVLVELGSSLLDLGKLDEASERLSQATELADPSGADAFYSGMGLAEVARRSGRPVDAVSLLRGLTPPDEEERHAWMAALATALSDAKSPDAEAAWAALADAADGDPGTRYTALRGQADGLVATDRSLEAIPLYEQAQQIAQEPWEEAWATLGLARAYAESDNQESAITVLDSLREHDDAEVRMEAAIRRSQIAADGEDWTNALRVLDPISAVALGPAWDATVTDARTRALVGAGDHTGAEAAWKALARRWPKQEEALLPAWLGLATIAQNSGDDVEAHRWARRAFKEAQDPGYRQQAREMVRSLANP